MTSLVIKGLRAAVAGTEILTGVDLTVSSGEVHAVMGPNGSGKSTLSHVLMGRPGYEVTGGSVTLDGVDVLSMPTWQRAQAGLFLAMQYPVEVPGVSLLDMLHAVSDAGAAPLSDLSSRLQEQAAAIDFDERFLDRPLNVDLSGGEQKRNETLQLGVLRPKIAILDELDSGLDVDGLATISRRIEHATNADDLGVLVITHYSRLLEQLRPDHVHVLVGGRIQASGGPELADELEETGYAAYLPAAAGAVPASTGADPFADPFADPLG
ncbi:MAG: Fe-S cluster assembly ATPase SufC [Acidimicrobiales bacterium]|nr:Fe-S cluster assembly ATPase SufC [Acidimicrobiales bacterium]